MSQQTTIKCILLCLLTAGNTSNAQVVLNADGPGNTYELINSVLAPNGDVIETPDCGHIAFGRHIDELFDNDLNTNVFRFTLHVAEDDDRCKNFDRQRNEIKSYSQSPDNLLGVLGEEVEYKWKFKLDNDFQASSSFTHLHQLKAVDGPEDPMPLITLTARKGSPDRLELRYAKALDQETLATVPLSELKGKWFQVTETVLYEESGKGKYAITIENIADSTILFEYTEDGLRMWKTDASFIRPKWGIYRSLNDESSLRDEAVLFADFQVTELNVDTNVPLSVGKGLQRISIYPNPTNDFISLDQADLNLYEQISFFDSVGKLLHTKEISKPAIDISSLNQGTYYLIISGKNVKPKVSKLIKK